jgi:hypothetical protein
VEYTSGTEGSNPSPSSIKERVYMEFTVSIERKNIYAYEEVIEADSPEEALNKAREDFINKAEFVGSGSEEDVYPKRQVELPQWMQDVLAPEALD